ncbi:MAG: FKBP-type peptidyl-prolyl cis-trans isomerase [Pontibacterium sp.]
MTNSSDLSTGAIVDGSQVAFHFTRTDQKGKALDSSLDGEPLSYVQGEGKIAQGLEEAMLGKKAGDEFEVTVTPEKGYGPHDEDLVEDVARENFKALEPLRTGTLIQVPDDETGELVVATIVDLGPKVVTIDRNHPYAGMSLVFSVKIVAVN